MSNTTYNESLDPTVQQKINQIAQLGQSGQLFEAEKLAFEVLEKHPSHPDALHMMALINLQRQDYVSAETFLTKAINIRPAPEYLLNLAVLCTYKNDLKSAEKYFKQAKKKSPNNQAVLYNYGVLLEKVGKYSDSIQTLQELVKLAPNNPQHWYTLGNVMQADNRLDKAIETYEKALALHPQFAEARLNQAVCQFKKRDYASAIVNLQNAIQVKPNLIEAYQNLAAVYVELGRASAAIEQYKKILSMKPDLVRIYVDYGNVVARLYRYKEAIDVYQKGLTYEPNNIDLLSGVLKCKQASCDWTNYQKLFDHFMSLVNQSLLIDQEIPHFNYLAYGLSPEKEFECATNIGRHAFDPHIRPYKFRRDKFSDRRIRIGYVSADVRNHPTAHLCRRLFELHNRDQFEVFLYSIGPSDDSMFRKDIEKASEHFIDLYESTIEQCIEKIHSDKIDILVDMMGYTEYSRTMIFAAKPAPIQLCFLAYPGTMGTKCIDYLVSDKTVVPEENRQWISEKLLYMPHTYFITDNQQPISDKQYTRQDQNLPEDSFVFCCFNRPYKITDEIFALWMSLLKQVNNSVLWLYVDHEETRAHLTQAAMNHQIDSNRLIFADHASKAEHLSRMKLADLFIDCFNVTAHTTAIDSLWAGVPVITKLGNTITSRASASILKAINLEECIATSNDDYMNKILDLANNPEKLAQLKQKLANNRDQSALFNTEQYVHDFEKGLAEIYQTWVNKNEFQHIEVEKLK